MINFESQNSPLKEMRDFVLKNSEFKEKLKKELVDFLIEVEPNKYKIYEKINIIFDFETSNPVIVMADLDFRHIASKVEINSLDRFYIMSSFSLYEQNTTYVNSEEAILWKKIDLEASIFDSTTANKTRDRKREDVELFVELKMTEIYSKINSSFLDLNGLLNRLEKNKSVLVNEVYENVLYRILPLRILTDNQIEQLFYMVSDSFFFGRHGYFYDPDNSKSQRVMAILNKSASSRLEENFELLKNNFSYLDDLGRSLMILHECEIINTDELLHYFSIVIKITGQFFTEHFLKKNMINSGKKNYLEYIMEVILSDKIKTEKTFNESLLFLNNLLAINSKPFVVGNRNLFRSIISKLIFNLEDSNFNNHNHNLTISLALFLKEFYDLTNDYPLSGVVKLVWHSTLSDTIRFVIDPNNILQIPFDLMELGQTYVKVLNLSKKKIYVDPDVEEKLKAFSYFAEKTCSEDKSYLFLKQFVLSLTNKK